MKGVLTPSEISEAAREGCNRRLRAMFRGRRFPGGWDAKRKNDPWSNDIEATAAELAFAKTVNLYWAPSPDPDYAGDVGGWQVRSITNADHNLLVYESDPDDKPVALVYIDLPAYEVVGWILARDAKREEWASNGRLARPGFIVPKSALEPLEEKAVAA